MATYAKEKGFTVQTLSTDPVASQAAGGTWASGGNTNSNHSGYGGSSGTYTAALVASNEPYGANVELYDGSSWTETGNLNTSRTSAYSAGTQPATWLGGGRTGPGSSTNNTETFNGSSWTEVNEMNTTRFSSGSTGTYTAGIAVAGNTFTDISRAVETWNGTTWSTHPNDYDADVADIITFGTTTAAIMAGGFDGPAPRGGSNNSVSTAYSYDGSTYTSITALPQTLNGATGTGSQTDAIAAGGNRYPADNTANTVAWNGTSWSQVQDVPTAAYAYGGAKATTSTENQLAFCGQPGAATSTFEWSAPSTFGQLHEGQLFYNSTVNAFKITENSVTAGSWSSGGNMNTARNQSGSSEASPSSQGLAVGGNAPPESALVESYNGTAWTEIADLNVGRRDGGSGGVYTSMGYFGGTGPGPDVASNELWDGSSWTESANLNDGRQAVRGSGSSSTSLLCFGGGDPSVRDITEEWDGSSWTEVNDMNTAREANPGSGAIPTTICAGGLVGSTSKGETELFDGTSWTETSDLNTNRYGGGCIGTSASSLVFGGDPPSPTYTAKTEFWNGTSWTEVGDLAVTRGWTNGFGTVFSAVAAGGYVNPPAGQTAVTEEWESSVANLTITSS